MVTRSMALYWLVLPAVLVIFLAFDSLRCWVTGTAQDWHRRLESRQRVCLFSFAAHFNALTQVHMDSDSLRWCTVHTDSPPVHGVSPEFLFSLARI
jgi:hypothetical protein